jgi:hypothetical protein
MPCIKYRDFHFQNKTLARIQAANDIIAEYERQGYALTLRQVYYQLVSRGIIENTVNSYKGIGAVINNARTAGVIDWDSIVDRTRHVRALAHWDHPRQIVESAAKQYHRDLWEDQLFHVEVWTEKDALIEIVEQTSNEYDVSCFSCRGYTSSSAMWTAAQRLREYNQIGKDCVIIHLGDHDPSGVDMTRDIRERMDTFGADVRVDRIALNMDQIQRYNPPPNPAKESDKRAKKYIKQYGNQSWELDALEPVELDRLIREQIEIYLDRKLYNQAKEKEEQERAEIYQMIQ